MWVCIKIFSLVISLQYIVRCFQVGTHNSNLGLYLAVAVTILVSNITYLNIFLLTIIEIISIFFLIANYAAINNLEFSQRNMYKNISRTDRQNEKIEDPAIHTLFCMKLLRYCADWSLKLQHAGFQELVFNIPEIQEELWKFHWKHLLPRREILNFLCYLKIVMLHLVWTDECSKCYRLFSLNCSSFPISDHAYEYQSKKMPKKIINATAMDGQFHKNEITKLRVYLNSNVFMTKYYEKRPLFIQFSQTSSKWVHFPKLPVQ